MRRFNYVSAIIALGAGVLAIGAPAEEARKDILTEASVWRSHITWMPAAVRTEQGPKWTRVYQNLKEASDPPPSGWTQRDFDDSSWTYWREPQHVETLKLKEEGGRRMRSPDGKDTGVTLYEPGQYGVKRSYCVGLHCLRGKFKVDDPAKVDGLSLFVEYRGGIVVYLNGREFGRGHLPKGVAIEPETLADDYPEEVFVDLREEKRKVRRKASVVADIPLLPEVIKRLNGRIRRIDIDVPAARLVKGINALAVEIHRPSCAPLGHQKLKQHDWGKCGLARIRLRGAGAVESAVAGPAGFHLWNVNALTRISPFGFTYVGRQNYTGGKRHPLTWGERYASLAPVRLTGPRNGFSAGQVGISCDKPIRGLKAVAGGLTRKGGSDRVDASAIDVLYMKVLDQACDRKTMHGPLGSELDALYESLPAEIPTRAAVETRCWADAWRRRGSVTTWMDAGASAAIWIRAKIPPGAPAGVYTGTLTVSADGYDPVRVPVELRVADWTLPEPRQWISHMGTPHSPDTLAIWYDTPRWSEAHWKLIEKTLAYMGEIGSKAVFLPVRAKTWFQNEESLVYWVKQPEGSFTYDYRIFDRYLDLVDKYLRPEVYCLYAVEVSRRGPTTLYSLLDPATGAVTLETGPEYKPTPEAIAFWKPVMRDVTARLTKRGVPREQIVLGMCWEGYGANLKDGNPKMDLFKAVIPAGMRLVQVAHLGGSGGTVGAIPFGYIMSVYGNRSPIKTKFFGARNLPMKIVTHYRINSSIDLRPGAHRGALRLCVERALKDTHGVGPIGMDFWHLPADPKKGRRRAGTVERTASPSLSMTDYSAGALLAPGPKGPIPTARFEMVREGLQQCEARIVIEKALADETARGRLGDALVKRCEDVIEKRERAYRFLGAHGWEHAEGWTWYADSGWEDRALDLFNCAGEVARKLKE